MKLYHYIFIGGGLLLLLNTLFPPMIYENWGKSENGTTRYYTTRNFFATRQVVKKDFKTTGANGTEIREMKLNLKINISPLVVENSMIIGLMFLMIGLSLPRNGIKPNTIQKNTQQGVAGYPPQGVGSPER